MHHMKRGRMRDCFQGGLSYLENEANELGEIYIYIYNSVYVYSVYVYGYTEPMSMSSFAPAPSVYLYICNYIPVIIYYSIVYLNIPVEEHLEKENNETYLSFPCDFVICIS